MRALRALVDLLRDPLASANREALGFVVLVYGGIGLLLGLLGLGAYLFL